MRLVWAGLGGVAMVLAVVGTALPIVPTVPFLLAAAFCFARSSPRLHRWLLTHPRFGGPIRAWQTHRAISAPVKRLAVASMAAGLVLGAVVLPLGLWAVQTLVIGAAAAFVLSRPSPPAPL